ncbi:hypothetical protein CR513_45035, partial [Mucuna pruriens]
MANPSQNDWSHLLEDALWAYRITFWTPLGMSTYWIVFSNACHLLVEIEHRAYWAIKKCNMAYDQAGHERKLILRKEFKVGQKVLLFNSQLKLIVGKLHSRWDRSFVVTNIFPYGVVKVKDEANNYTFKLKPYYEDPNLSSNEGEVEIITLMEPAHRVEFFDQVRADSGSMLRPGPCRLHLSPSFFLFFLSFCRITEKK